MLLALKSLGALSVLIALLLWVQSAAKAPQKPLLTPPTPAADVTAAATAATTAASADSTSQVMYEKTITSFEQSSSEAPRWQNVNDNVMGGVSQGQMSFTAQGTGLFRGTLSLENNGGFSSVRRDASDYDFSGVSRIVTRVRGDGRRYQLRVHSRNDDSVIYRFEFETVEHKWQTVSVPLSGFEPVFRGRIVESAPPLSADVITQVGFLIADKKSGNFTLEIDWIAAE